ncbi:LysR family transcriptional regulator [Lentilitoribacter sp. EG35]|uniref:LysR family transcriptional regulator n=1 Tax=Lentilitoribacter sp. EG35 TaxID=3234192 RepID=UPI0034606EED
MVIKIEMLKYFVAVAQSGNLSDAADKLGRTPSAVSMMLKQLEDHLGAPLFESDRKSKLTSLGTFTLDEAARGLDHFQRTSSAIENYAHAKSGFVRIAVVPSVAGTILPEVVERFLEKHPNVHIDIRDMDSAAVHRDIISEQVDLGIASDVDIESQVESKPLFSDAFGIVCSNNHPLTELDFPLDWSELHRYPFIANGLCSQISDDAFQSVFKASKLMVRSTTSLLALIKTGIGISVLPKLVVDNARGDICFLAVNDSTARRHIAILHRANTQLSPAIKNFEKTIQDVVSQAN